MPLRNVGRWSAYYRRVMNGALKQDLARDLERTQGKLAVRSIRNRKSTPTKKELQKATFVEGLEEKRLAEWRGRTVRKDNRLSRIRAKIITATVLDMRPSLQHLSTKNFAELRQATERYELTGQFMVTLHNNLTKKFGKNDNWPVAAQTRIGQALEEYEAQKKGNTKNCRKEWSTDHKRN